MELRIAAALKQVGDYFPFELTEVIEPQQFGGRQISFELPLTVTGLFVFDGKAFSVEGKVRTALRSVCARCAESFSETLKFSFSERYVKGAEQEPDSEIYAYEGDAICLDQAVMDNLFLHLPLTSVCREDCKGLCPVCGTNRNIEPCSCEEVRPHSAFSALNDIRNDY